MKTFLLLLFLSLLGIHNISARRLSEKEAAEIAQNVLNNRDNLNHRSTDSRGKLSRMKMISPELSSEINDNLYIFNRAGGGFAVIAGYTGFSPVLAYDEIGSLAGEMNPAISYWLEFLSEQIENLKRQNLVSLENNSPNATLHAPIAPLLKTQWGQKEPFNNLAPEVVRFLSKRAPAGCVALCAAQIMNFWQFPSRGSGSITYYDKASSKNRSMDFDALPDFNWNNILDFYDTYASQEECLAVASLLNAVGHACQTQYAESVSLSTQEKAVAALIKYFGFEPTAHHYERNLIDDKTWHEIVINELSAGRPILYSGSNTTNSHAFICDGYDGNNLFHFNWGWYGKSDGWFALSVLNPFEQGTGGSASGYSLNQKINTRVFPKGYDSSREMSYGRLRLDSLSITEPHLPTTLKITCSNLAYTPFEGKICISTTSECDNVEIQNNSIAVAIEAQDTCTLEIPITQELFSQLKHQNFKILFCGSHDNSLNEMVTTKPESSSFSLTIKDNEIALCRNEEVASLTLGDSFNPEIDVVSDIEASVSFMLANNSEWSFQGSAGLVLRRNDNTEYLYSTEIYRAPGDNYTAYIKIPLHLIPEQDFTLEPFYSHSPAPSIDEIIYLSEPVTIKGFNRNHSPSIAADNIFVDIYNLSGEKIFHCSVKELINTLHSLPQDTYICRFSSGDIVKIR